MPLALSTSEKYVVAAYLVFLALVLIYVAIMAVRMGRLQREIDEVVELLDRREAPDRDRVAV